MPSPCGVSICQTFIQIFIAAPAADAVAVQADHKGIINRLTLAAYEVSIIAFNVPVAPVPELRTDEKLIGLIIVIMNIGGCIHCQAML